MNSNANNNLKNEAINSLNSNNSTTFGHQLNCRKDESEVESRVCSEMSDKMFRIQATEKWIKDNEYNCFKKSQNDGVGLGEVGVVGAVGGAEIVKSEGKFEKSKKDVKFNDSLNKDIYYGFPNIGRGGAMKSEMVFKESGEGRVVGVGKGRGWIDMKGKSKGVMKPILKEEKKPDLTEHHPITFSTFKQPSEPSSHHPPLPPPPPPPIFQPRHHYPPLPPHHHHHHPPPSLYQYHHPQCHHYHPRPLPPPPFQPSRSPESSLLNQLLLKKLMYDDSSDV